jgi:hypothetical protein
MVPLVEKLEVQPGHAQFRPGPLRLHSHTGTELIIDSDDAGCEELCERAAAAVRFFADRQVQIALFPEAVVPDPVLLAIKDELRRLSASGCEYPVLTLAGTFGRTGSTADGLPYNQGVVLNNRGDELWRQSKLHPYGMQPYEQRRYGVEKLFSATAIEHITTHPRRLIFCDSRKRAMRMVVTICEDSAQEDPCLTAIRGMHPNLVMIPVMAGPLEGSSFVNTVKGLTQAPGCLAVVTNSAALARAAWPNGQPGEETNPPLGIIGTPLCNDAATHKSVHLLAKIDRVHDSGPEVLIFRCPS